MVTDIPTKEDFDSLAYFYLNTAWDTALTLIRDHDELQTYLQETVDLYNSEQVAQHQKISDDYWPQASRSLVAAAATVQHAAEFFLKGRIAAIDATHLLAKRPSKSSETVSFHTLRTVSASDLVSLHNSVCKKDTLSQTFVTDFEGRRDLRNRVMHSAATLTETAHNVLLSVLRTHDEFSNDRQWWKTRENHIGKLPGSGADGGENAECQLYSEMQWAIYILCPADVMRHFHLDRTRMTVVCCDCYKAYADRVALVQPLASLDEDGKYFCHFCRKNVDPRLEECIHCHAEYILTNDSRSPSYPCRQCGKPQGELVFLGFAGGLA